MTKLEKRKELSVRVISLVTEYIIENGMVEYDIISNLKPSKDFEYISFIDEHEEEKVCFLTDAADFLREDLEGWGGFHEEIDLSIANLEDDYRNKRFKTKEEFINYAGSLYYRWYRSEEILKELKTIEKEAALATEIPEF